MATPCPCARVGQGARLGRSGARMQRPAHRSGCGAAAPHRRRHCRVCRTSSNNANAQHALNRSCAAKAASKSLAASPKVRSAAAPSGKAARSLVVSSGLRRGCIRACSGAHGCQALAQPPNRGHSWSAAPRRKRFRVPLPVTCTNKRLAYVPALRAASSWGLNGEWPRIRPKQHGYSI